MKIKIITVIVIIGLMISIFMIYKDLIAGRQFKKEHGYSRFAAPCVEDCYKLGYEYLRYDSTGFGSNECWCVNGTKPIQIW